MTITKTLAVLALAAGLSSSLAAEDLIKDGKLVSKEMNAGKWTKKSNLITGSGVGNSLLCNSVIAAGDFTLEAEVELDKVNVSASGFILGSNLFGFDGHGKKLFPRRI